jgi:hypothetical protein
VDPVPDPLLLRKCGSAANRTRDLWICSQELGPLDRRGGLRKTLGKTKRKIIRKRENEEKWGRDRRGKTKKIDEQRNRIEIERNPKIKARHDVRQEGRACLVCWDLLSSFYFYNRCHDDR